jgi:hypothetical protein
MAIKHQVGELPWIHRLKLDSPLLLHKKHYNPNIKKKSKIALGFLYCIIPP